MLLIEVIKANFCGNLNLNHQILKYAILFEKASVFFKAGENFIFYALERWQIFHLIVPYHFCYFRSLIYILFIIIFEGFLIIIRSFHMEEVLDIKEWFDIIYPQPDQNRKDDPNKDLLWTRKNIQKFINFIEENQGLF